MHVWCGCWGWPVPAAATTRSKARTARRQTIALTASSATRQKNTPHLTWRPPVRPPAPPPHANAKDGTHPSFSLTHTTHTHAHIPCVSLARLRTCVLWGWSGVRDRVYGSSAVLAAGRSRRAVCAGRRGRVCRRHPAQYVACQGWRVACGDLRSAEGGGGLLICADYETNVVEAAHFRTYHTVIQTQAEYISGMCLLWHLCACVCVWVCASLAHGRCGVGMASVHGGAARV
jgi:hypothetical protein